MKSETCIWFKDYHKTKVWSSDNLDMNGNNREENDGDDDDDVNYDWEELCDRDYKYGGLFDGNERASPFGNSWVPLLCHSSNMFFCFTGIWSETN